MPIQRGLQPLPNVRIRGKIPRSQWPKIAARFQNGETLTEIARRYDCTAPAIRYIVGRVPMLVPPIENRRTTRIGSTEDRSDISRGQGSLLPDSATRDIWGRVNTDIATFLAAIDSLFSHDSDNNYDALLAATDRLLWASARTRLELEHILGNRKRGASIRRIPG